MYALDLAEGETSDIAKNISPLCLMIEEFIARAALAGRITSDSFTEAHRKIHFHGHCFQKALVGTEASVAALNIPENYSVTDIPSGCCGMAGSFGYEKEHYEISMNIGELVLFPAVRDTTQEDIISAPGTSCRHQIHDGTERKALHPVEVLRDALR